MKSLLLATLDSALILGPMGFGKGRFHFVKTGIGLRLKEATFEGNGAEAPPPPFGISLDTEALRLSDAALDWCDALLEQGKSWDGATLEVSFPGDGAAVQLLSAAGTPVWVDRVDDDTLALLLCAPALARLLAASAAARKQLPHSDASVAPEGALPLGTLELPSSSWTWADGPALERALGRAVRAPGLSALWRPSFFADEGFAQVLCAQACVALGRAALVRFPEPELHRVSWWAR